MLIAALLLWLTVPAPAVITTLNFDDFESSLRAYWSAYQYLGNDTVISRTNEVAAPDGSSYVMKAYTTTKSSGGWGTYVYFTPDEAAQGDRFAYERALDVGSWVGGVNRVMEFWSRTSNAYNAPVETGGLNGNEQMSFGSFTMALSRRGDGSACPTGQSLAECKGNHGYHGGQLPANGNRWIKWKFMVPGFRSTTQFYPAARGVVATSSGTLTPYETVNCQPSNSNFSMGNDTTHYGQTVVFLLWHVWNVLPTTSDTCTGQTSMATRTFSAVTQFDASTYGEHNRTSAVGLWTGFNARWFNDGGANYEWRLDDVATPQAAYWDRVSRFYLSSQPISESQLPTTEYYDGFVFKDDDRDDNVTIANLYTYYHETDSKLFFGFSRNQEIKNKTWEIRTSASDIHTLGFSNATAWGTIADSGNDYNTVQVYRTFTPPAQTFYIAVRPNDQSPFAQMEYRIPDAQWDEPPDPGSSPGRSGGVSRRRR